MIVVPEYLIEVLIYPDHENRMPERILNGAGWTDETGGTALDTSASRYAPVTTRPAIRVA
jgi:hypothetical protein